MGLRLNTPSTNVLPPGRSFSTRGNNNQPLRTRRNTMLKHLIVAAVSLSSLAFAGPSHRSRPVLVPPPPAPVSVPAPNVGYGYGYSGEHADVARGQTLLRDLNAAIARRDFRR